MYIVRAANCVILEEDQRLRRLTAIAAKPRTEEILSESRGALKASGHYLSKRARYRATLQQARSTATTLRLLDSLFVNPLVTTARAAAILEVSRPTARAAIEALGRHGIVREISGRRWGRVYAAEELLMLMGGEPEIS